MAQLWDEQRLGWAPALTAQLGTGSSTAGILGSTLWGFSQNYGCKQTVTLAAKSLTKKSRIPAWD